VKSHYVKFVRVALLYGSFCFLAFWGLSLVGWWLFPNYSKDDELMRQMRWLSHTVGEKIASLVLLSVTAFLASSAHHPTGKWGVATGIAAAVAFQLISVLVYVVQFGVATYHEYNGFLYTMWWTVILAWVFGYFAVRRQCLHEKLAA
jgi:magnesium-transporting ATPase (P-type)